MFTEAIVIIQEEYESLISAALSRLKLNIKLDFFRIKEDLGTADSLRLIHDKIKVRILQIYHCSNNNQFVFFRLMFWLQAVI